MSLIIVAQSNYLVSQSLTTTEGSYITDDYTNNAKEFDCPTFDIILKFAMLRSPTLLMRSYCRWSYFITSVPSGRCNTQTNHIFALCRYPSMTTRVNLFHIFIFSMSLPLDQTRSSRMTFPFHACFLNIKPISVRFRVLIA